MVSLTEPHNTARETPARGSFAASRPGLPLGVLGGRGAGVGAESVAPREAVRSHSGEAIRGSWPVCLVPETGCGSNSKSVPKAWPCWPGSVQASGAPSLPFPLGSSPQAAPSLHQEAFPLSRNVSLQWKNGHCSFSGKRPPSPPSFLASCSWLLSPTAEQPRLSAHLRACLPSDWPPLPTLMLFRSPSQLALASLFSLLQSHQTPRGEASCLGPPSALPGPYQGGSALSFLPPLHALSVMRHTWPGPCMKRHTANSLTSVLGAPRRHRGCRPQTPQGPR